MSDTKSDDLTLQNDFKPDSVRRPDGVHPAGTDYSTSEQTPLDNGSNAEDPEC